MSKDRDFAESAGLSRRRFVAGAAATMVVIGAVPMRARTQEMPRLDESDPQAVALKYVHDATTVDPSLRPEERFCRNCALYTGGDEPWGGCGIFPGKLVSANGWCSVWAPRGQ